MHPSSTSCVAMNIFVSRETIEVIDNGSILKVPSKNNVGVEKDNVLANNAKFDLKAD